MVSNWPCLLEDTDERLLIPETTASRISITILVSSKSLDWSGRLWGKVDPTTDRGIARDLRTASTGISSSAIVNA